VAPTVAVRVGGAFLARSIDAGSVSTALRVTAARRRLTSQNGHTVTHGAVVLIMSAGVAFPAVRAVPHRLQIDRVVGTDQTVRRLLFVQKSFGHITPRAPVVTFRGSVLARVHCLELSAFLLALDGITSIVVAASAVPHALSVGSNHHRCSEAEGDHLERMDNG